MYNPRAYNRQFTVNENTSTLVAQIRYSTPVVWHFQFFFVFVPSPKNLIAQRAHLESSLCLSEVDITFYKKLLIGLESSVRGNLPLACLATVSSRVIVPKLQDLKKGKMEGGGGGGKRNRLLPLQPLFNLFALVPMFSTKSRGNVCYAG